MLSRFRFLQAGSFCGVCRNILLFRRACLCQPRADRRIELCVCLCPVSGNLPIPILETLVIECQIFQSQLSTYCCSPELFSPTIGRDVLSGEVRASVRGDKTEPMLQRIICVGYPLPSIKSHNRYYLLMVSKCTAFQEYKFHIISCTWLNRGCFRVQVAQPLWDWVPKVPKGIWRNAMINSSKYEHAHHTASTHMKLRITSTTSSVMIAIRFLDVRRVTHTTAHAA
jgi:hypothetical protein